MTPSEHAATIDEVARDYLQELWRSPLGHRLIRLSLPPGERIGDHASEFRVLLIFEDLEFLREATGEPLRVEAPSALCLPSGISGAVVNASSHAERYVALLFPASMSNEPTDVDPSIAQEAWALATDAAATALLVHPRVLVGRHRAPPGIAEVEVTLDPEGTPIADDDPAATWYLALR